MPGRDVTTCRRLTVLPGEPVEQSKTTSVAERREIPARFHLPNNG